jgi:soluble lytic murein transglycosylase-like protein
MHVLLLLLGLSAVADDGLRAQARTIASQHDLDPELFVALIEVESQFKVGAFNARTRDYGLTQINEYNVKALNLDRRRLLTDPAYNLNAGATVLKYFKRRYAHKEKLWYARYNCGTFTGTFKSKCVKYANLINAKRGYTVAKDY